MFRDSRGVVHTVSSTDPLGDLPAGAVRALQEALLTPACPGAPVDLGGVLGTAEAVRELLGRWQDAFFAALPDDVDLEEEARWAAEAGLSLADVEAHEPPELDLPDDDDDDQHDHVPADDLALLLEPPGPDDPRAALPEPLVTALERELLLLPVRVRLEALVAADDLVQEWTDLVGDHEKLLGHVVLAHGRLPPEPELGHDALHALHARMHAAGGPGHDQ